MFCHVVVKNYLCNVLCKFLIKIESTWRREIKEQTLQMTLLYCGRTARSNHRRCSIKKVVLKNFAIFHKFLRLSILKNICERLLFDRFNGSLLCEPKVSRSRLHDGVRFRVRVTSLVFLVFTLVNFGRFRWF